MKKMMLLLLLISCSMARMYAQVYSNNISAYTGVLYTGGSYFYLDPLTQGGISYSRKVYKSLGISAAFYYFLNRNNGFPEPQVYKNQLYLYEPQVYAPKPNNLYARIGYKTIDVVPTYTLKIGGNKHLLTAGAGVSYSWGKNMYYKYWDLNSGDIIDVAYYYKNAGYWGAATQIAYNYYFLHNRINVGLQARYRYLFGLNEYECDGGLMAGFNF